MFCRERSDVRITGYHGGIEEAVRKLEMDCSKGEGISVETSGKDSGIPLALVRNHMEEKFFRITKLKMDDQEYNMMESMFESNTTVSIETNQGKRGYLISMVGVRGERVDFNIATYVKYCHISTERESKEAFLHEN